MPSTALALVLLLGCERRAPTPERLASASSSAPDAAPPAAITCTPPSCDGRCPCPERSGCQDGRCVRDPSWRIEELALGGATFGCARYTNGHVWCAGDNTMGQLGRGPRGSGAPAPVRGIEDATRLVAGVFHACALDKSRHVSCWGLGTSGETGTGKREIALAPERVAGLDDAIELASGNSHTCAIKESGQVTCWGSGDAGQLGGYRTSPAESVMVKGVEHAKQLALGFRHSCALTREGAVFCWGRLGGERSEARRVGGLGRVDEIAANQESSCARTGEVVTCWGGYFGRTARAAVALNGASSLAGANDVMCARARAGSVTCVDPDRSWTPFASDASPAAARLLAVGAAWPCMVGEDDAVRCSSALPPRRHLEAL